MVYISELGLGWSWSELLLVVVVSGVKCFGVHFEWGQFLITKALASSALQSLWCPHCPCRVYTSRIELASHTFALQLGLHSVWHECVSKHWSTLMQVEYIEFVWWNTFVLITLYTISKSRSYFLLFLSNWAQDISHGNFTKVCPPGKNIYTAGLLIKCYLPEHCETRCLLL